MGLSIFSFDFQAFIESLPDFADEPATGITGADNFLAATTAADNSLAATTEILQDLASDAVTASVMAAQVVRNAVDAMPTAPRETPPSKTAAAPPMTEQEKKDFLQMIRALQTSVVFSCKDTDLIKENISMKMAKAVLNTEKPEDSASVYGRVRDDKKRADLRQQKLHEDLRRAVLKNPRQV